ncbi:MAG TPA: phosphatase PAP2 family protein [Lacunisphaera sp.]|nr:phosphatase PAP2 family protein [Lacunisphaera sp.]
MRWQELIGRIRALAGRKAALTLAVNALFWGGYGWLARHAVFPVRPMATTAIDRAVAFAPEPWAAVYLSQFLLTGLLPWLIDAAEVLRRYVVALLLLSGASFVIFLLWPVASPRPVELPAGGLMAWIARADGSYNAFPSLHAGFLVLVGGLGWRMFARRPAWPAAGVFALWAAAILYATLATRQHYFWDLVAGLALGLGSDRTAWRGFTRTARPRLGTPG